MIYTWQTSAWTGLVGRLDRLPHALLLAGPAGVGKRDFAVALAGRLFCEEAAGTDQACGTCPACRWFKAGNHPDFRLVTPEADEEPPAANQEGDEQEVGGKEQKGKPSKQIRIDQVRALGELAAVGTHQAGRRVIVLQPAEAMNVHTANALLKLLEEPPSSITFILVSNAPFRLLPTIRSRCRTILFGRPEPALARNWLADAGVKNPELELAFFGGYPVSAAAWAESADALRARTRVVVNLADGPALDPLAFAAECETMIKSADQAGTPFGLAALVDWVQKWVVDLLRVKAGLPAGYFVAEAERLNGLAAGAVSAQLFDCYNYLVKLKRYVEHPLNARLFIEDLMIRYARAVTPRGVR